MKRTVTLEICGNCKGPALRPFIWSMVTKTSLGGWVSNTVDGVQLFLEGDPLDITLFLRTFPDRIAKRFHISTIRLLKQKDIPGTTSVKPFRLIGPILYDNVVRPDRVPCPDCKKEMLNPGSRFYRYPFLNCRDCGPDYSVSMMAGAERSATAFHVFPPCRKCAANLKENPLSSCPECGPSVFLINNNCESIPSEDPVAVAAEAIANGKIVAVKNYDGFVILCHPDFPETLRLLRERKQQPGKPFSLYLNTTEVLHRYFELTPEEEQLLTSSSAPLMLMKFKRGAIREPELFCPDFPGTIGVAFPPSGLIHLLLESAPDGSGGFKPFEMLAFTGGPVPVDPADAGGDNDLAEVCRIADYILMHDLKIWHSSGHSVISLSQNNGKQTIRRSSGIAPFPLTPRRPLKRTVLALGSDSSAAVSLGYKNKIYMSHQMGDIESEQNSMALSHAAEHLSLMFARVPEMIVCDIDPLSFSYQRGVSISEQYRLPLTTAQRHHANALACMVEHQLTDALALVWDGGANGLDGNIWGAELLEVSCTKFRRLATFAPVAMNRPRERSLRPPFLLVRYFDQCGVTLTDELAELLKIPMSIYREWKQKQDPAQMTDTHAALTLFDAVSAAIGIAMPVKNYSQQTLLCLERAVADGSDQNAIKRLKPEFPFTVQHNDLFQIDWSPFFLRADNYAKLREESPGDLALAFLSSITDAAVQMVQYGTSVSKVRKVLLSGKAFFSPTLLYMIKERLESMGFQVYHHVETASDESSVSIGQAVFGGMT